MRINQQGIYSGTLSRTKDVGVSIDGTSITIERMPPHDHSEITGYCGKHKHVSPIKEDNDSERWNKFVSPSVIYNEEEKKNYYGYNAAADECMKTGVDNDNYFLLTSSSVSFDDGWNSNLFNELYNLPYKQNDVTFINVPREGHYIDYKGNHAHKISMQGGGQTHTHSVSITQPEFSFSSGSSSTLDNRMPYTAVYYICKVS